VNYFSSVGGGIIGGGGIIAGAQAGAAGAHLVRQHPADTTVRAAITANTTNFMLIISFPQIPQLGIVRSKRLLHADM
jgi:hypothetical protein